ncbi:MAG: hypothetical protein E7317_01530 [Clostridiales bacterium]|nr:hypothetical protein [Clostridiales bacterium]
MAISYRNLDDKTAIRALDVNVQSIETGVPSAVFVGSNGDIYHATLEECDCPDFQIRGKKKDAPCKHIARLMLECGVIDKNAVLEYIAYKKQQEKELEKRCRDRFAETVLGK